MLLYRLMNPLWEDRLIWQLKEARATYRIITVVLTEADILLFMREIAIKWIDIFTKSFYEDGPIFRFTLNHYILSF